jgi:hypothetical protein
MLLQHSTDIPQVGEDSIVLQPNGSESRSSRERNAAQQDDCQFRHHWGTEQVSGPVEPAQSRRFLFPSVNGSHMPL